jgi:hypothetical protein
MWHGIIFIYFIYSATFLWRELIGYSSPKDSSTEGGTSAHTDMFLNVTYYDIVIMDNLLTRKAFSFVWLLPILRACQTMMCE